MSYSKLQLPQSLRLPKGSLIFIVIVLFFIADTGLRLIRAYQLEGEWAIFDSQNRLVGNDDPDGFRLEYPTGWSTVAYSNGSVKNLGEKRAGFFIHIIYLVVQKRMYPFGGGELMMIGQGTMPEIGILKM